jgi:hypothetical protein
VQVIDPAKMDLRKTFTVPVDPFDAAAGDNGLLFLSGAGGEWTDVAVVDTRKETVVARWGGVWRRSFVKLSPEGDRLYYSTQGVSPGRVEGLAIPRNVQDKPVPYVSPAVGTQSLGGDFVVSPDGKFLLCKTGAVLALSREEDLKHALTTEEFVAAAVAPGAGAVFALAPDGSLRQHSYPDFRPQATYRLAGAGYQLAWDGGSGRLYVAAVDPKALSERPRGRGLGEIHVYDLKSVLAKAK